MEERIHLASPHMCGKEEEYVRNVFETNWIAPLGPHVNAFESELSEYVGVHSAAALNSGTSALHLALIALGVTDGDIVFCSSLTFSASANPIVYQNATPVFIDSEPSSFNMSPQALEKAFQGHQPKAVIVVHLYGQSADMDAIREICSRYNTPIIEDAAESLGATYKNKMTGSLGDFGVFSFNGNKIITTSGGGMLVSNNKKAIDKSRFWATQSRDKERHYQHSELGYNYRMSNVCAAIGRGQLTALDERIAQKKNIYETYKEGFSDISDIKMAPVCDYGEPNYWLSVIILRQGSAVTPLEIMLALEAENIESRPVWKPMHLQPYYEEFLFYSHYETGRSVAEYLFDQGVCLPSDTKLTKAQQERIIQIVRSLWSR